MADLSRLSEPELAAALQDVGRRLGAPAASGLSVAVSGRLAAGGGPERRFRLELRLGLQPVPTLRRVVALAAALLILLATVAAAATFAVRGVRIVFSPTAPTVTPTTSVVPFASRLRLGERTSLAHARASVTYSVLLPTAADIGAPDAVFLNQEFPGGQVSLVYRVRAGLPPAPTPDVGLLVTEFRAGIDRRFLEKVLGPGTRLEQVRINGLPAFWIQGAPHEVFYVGRNGEPIADTIRLSGNVLLWQSSEVTIRIEGEVSKGKALRIAESMR